MDAHRLEQIEDLYHQACERPASERAAFLQSVCGDDPALLREVLGLLAQPSAAGPMDQPAIGAAAALLDDSSSVVWSPGERVGPYQIVSRVGQGGMGQVFAARDTRLGRQVAIKVVRREFSGRFRREARAISALNHPHICTLYDAAADYLVMELVEGETLASRVQKGPLPMELVLRYGAQIADALAAAHSKGITHRDLKPANVMISKTGVKVLDFGLARFAGNPDLQLSQTDTATAPDTIVGTPAYMAPEQLEGKACDARTDIFALGLVLYEMAAGRRAFAGESRAAMTAEIMRCEPRPIEGVPPQFAHLVERCLAKDPDERWQSAWDLKLELEFQMRSKPAASAPAARRRRPWLLPLIAGLAALASVIAWLVFTNRPPQPLVTRFTSFPGSEVTPSFSPDGDRIAFAWDGGLQNNFQIYVKMIGPGNLVRLTHSIANDVLPKWSPDARWIAFLRRTLPGAADVYVIPAQGGLERKLGEVAYIGEWLNGLDWSPDGLWLLVSRSSSPARAAGVALISFETGAVRQLTDPNISRPDRAAAFAPDGHALAFLRPGTTSAVVQPLSASWQPAGSAREIPLPLPVAAFVQTLTWSADSRDLIIATGALDNAILWRMPASGRSRPETMSFAGEATSAPSVSRKGERLVFARHDREWNIWQLDLDDKGRAAGNAVPAFESSKSEICPTFSPDGTRVAFESSRSGNDEIWECRADGSDCAQLTFLLAPHSGSPAWSPDGKWIAFDTQLEAGQYVAIISSDGGKPRVLARGGVPRWSRDGASIYLYRRGETYSLGPSVGPNDRRTVELYRMPASGGEARRIVAEAGVAFESPDGKWLYYSNSDGGMGDTFLRRVPLAGGESSEVLPAVSGRNFFVTNSGVWYLTPSTREGSLLQYYDLASRSTRTVYRTSKPVYAGLSVSPDGRHVLFTQVDRASSFDLMLVEHFR